MKVSTGVHLSTGMATLKVSVCVCSTRSIAYLYIQYLIIRQFFNFHGPLSFPQMSLKLNSVYYQSKNCYDHEFVGETPEKSLDENSVFWLACW